MKTKPYLTKIEEEIMAIDSLIFPDCEIAPEKVKFIMVDEIPPFNPDDDFFSKSPKASYPKTTLGLFNLAGIDVKSIYKILDMGIYITTAVKVPRNKKVDKTVSNEMIQKHLPILETELALFPNLKAIILMSGTAIKAINYIVKKQIGKNLIPLGYI